MKNTGEALSPYEATLATAGSGPAPATATAEDDIPPRDWSAIQATVSDDGDGYVCLALDSDSPTPDRLDEATMTVVARLTVSEAEALVSELQAGIAKVRTRVDAPRPRVKRKDAVEFTFGPLDIGTEGEDSMVVDLFCQRRLNATMVLFLDHADDFVDVMRGQARWIRERGNIDRQIARLRQIAQRLDGDESVEATAP